MRKIVLIFSLIFSTLSYGQDIETKSIYSETANAKDQIAQAVSLASKNNKNILLLIGGNWCSWCLAFDKLITSNEEIKKYLNDNYEVVHINHSKVNKNEEILKKLKHPERFGFPVFVVLDSKGELIHTQNSAYLENRDSKDHNPKLVLEFLKGWSYSTLNK